MRLIDLPDDPPVAGGRDVPELRNLLLDRWRPGNHYHQAALMLQAMGEVPEGFVAHLPQFDAHALAHAELWWVTPDMTQVVAHAAQSLPATTLCDDLVPSNYGLVVFADPLLGHAADTDETIRVRVLLWGVTTISWLHGKPMIATDKTMDHGGGRPRLYTPEDCHSLTISCYGRTGESIALASDRPGAWMPQGRSDWRWDTDTSEPAFDGHNADLLASMEEERRWLATLWLLASQPLTDTGGRARAPRPVRRRAQRAGGLAGRLIDGEVRLVDVRRRGLPQAPGVPEGAAGRRWGHRTIVAGHWRQQPYGPARSLRRPQFIAEHIAGPDDRPLVLRETVNVVRTDPSEAP